MMNTNSGAQKLYDKSSRFIDDATSWVTNNSVDIALALAIGIVIALILIGLRTFGHRLIRDNVGGVQWRTIFGRVLARTSLFFIIMCAAQLVASQAASPAAIRRAINFLFVIAAAFQAAIWGRELILGFVQHKAGMDEEHSTLGSALGIIRLLVTVTLFAIAIILILDNLGVNVTGLVAGLGIGGIAIGLAAQGIFSDLFAALSIIFDKPFRRGDGIRFGDITGTVEQIGLKTTRIRSLSGEEVVVSNAKLLDERIHNFALLDHRRIVTILGIVYQTPPDLIARIPDIVRQAVGAQPHATLVRCGMVGFGASSLDFEVQFDIHTPDFELTFTTRHAIFTSILKAFAEAGIAFAYPTQTSYTAAPDGSFVLPYPPPKIGSSDSHVA